MESRKGIVSIQVSIDQVDFQPFLLTPQEAEYVGGEDGGIDFLKCKT